MTSKIQNECRPHLGHALFRLGGSVRRADEFHPGAEGIFHTGDGGGRALCRRRQDDRGDHGRHEGGGGDRPGRPEDRPRGHRRRRLRPPSCCPAPNPPPPLSILPPRGHRRLGAAHWSARPFKGRRRRRRTTTDAADRGETRPKLPDGKFCSVA